MSKVSGVKEFLTRLRRIRGSATNQKIVAVLYSMGQAIELEAERSITSGSVSGKNHVASLPGEAPNADTRHLDTNIETRIESRYPPTVHVESFAEYSAALEYGTEKMAERPFMRPAAAKIKKKVPKAIAEAVNTEIRKKG